VNKTKLREYRKSAIAATGAILTVAATAFPNDKYVIAAVAVATAFGVWRVPNARTPAQRGTLISSDRTPVPPGTIQGGPPGAVPSRTDASGPIPIKDA